MGCFSSPHTLAMGCFHSGELLHALPLCLCGSVWADTLSGTGQPGRNAAHSRVAKLGIALLAA